MIIKQNPHSGKTWMGIFLLTAFKGRYNEQQKTKLQSY